MTEEDEILEDFLELDNDNFFNILSDEEIEYDLTNTGLSNILFVIDNKLKYFYSNEGLYIELLPEFQNCIYLENDVIITEGEDKLVMTKDQFNIILNILK